jgi:ATP-dependent DNA helicase RecG
MDLFLPKSVEDVVLNDTPKKCIVLLVEAMKNLDMIETQGGGIRKIFNFQNNDFFHFQIITLMIIR